MSTVRTRLVVLAAAGAASAAGIGVVAAPAHAHAVPRCGNGSLAVTRTFTQGAAGTAGFALIYRNTTRHTCSVTGYPGLDAVTTKGHVLAHAARVKGVRARTVQVRPGAYATAGVEWRNFDASTCRTSAAIRTTVPNTTRGHRLPVRVSVCHLRVLPTVAGTPGYPHYGSAQRWWIRGSHSSSAELNHYLRKSEDKLKLSGDYPSPVAQLKQLISFPETSLTKKQVKQARADIVALDSFFATPGLYL